MTRPATRKDHPLSMRLPEADIALIDRAAKLRGHSRTQFVRDSAVRAAEEAVMDSLSIRLNTADFEAFVAMLAKPAERVPAMAELLRRPAPWDRPDSAEGA
ncbi:MAG: hypothetical protein B7Z40_07640 [Bosea sp. 12-68-7]|nr:MAG: hypothetical protein B7Z40_07640 [Bosea sp. 12-68-7]